MDAKSWIERVANEPPATVAKKLGITPSTLDSQMKSANGLKPETVVRISRAYGSDPVAALVELGLLQAGEVGGEVDLSEAAHHDWLHQQDDSVILAEIGRRLEGRKGRSSGGVTPLKPKGGPRGIRSVPVDQTRASRKDAGKPKLSDS